MNSHGIAPMNHGIAPMNQDTSYRADLLHELLDDQLDRWHRGERRLVEDYVTQHPALASQPQVLLALISSEVSLRLEHGESPALDEYLGRFQDHADSLRNQWHYWFAIGGEITDPKEPSTLSPEVARDGEPLPTLPGYQILEELGQGAMGVVYRGWHKAFDRQVAIKFLFPGHKASGVALTRFETEARAVGRLKHPGVVAVHDTGIHEGRPFLVMELLSGSLAERIRKGLPEFRWAAETVRDLAKAMQAVHEAGIVHRDLKPGNILLTEAGKPKVADFGLAKLAEGGINLTLTGQVIGTPAYMPPEQARGDIREVGPLADVYALGATLYACLTGRPPYLGKDHAATRTLVLEGNLTPPSRLRQGLPERLEAVCLRCLERNPADRYASAGELADELTRWLEGQVVQAPTAVERGWRWAGRKLERGAAGLSLAALAVLAFSVLAAVSPEPEAEGDTAEGRRLVQELAAGKRVSLFDRTGQPRRPRVVRGGLTGRLTTFNGTFAIQSNQPYLLELAPDPARPTYRLQAEIRHHRSSPVLGVGLYVGHRHVQARAKAFELFTSVAFNDVVPEWKSWETMRRQVKKRLPPELLRKPRNRVHHQLQLKASADWDEESGVSVCLPSPEVFDVGDWTRPEWRVLTVEVTPTGVRSYWGKAKQFMQEIDVNQSFPTALEYAPGAPDQRFAPRGGLGLYLSNGVASFRNVWIEPLQ